MKMSDEIIQVSEEFVEANKNLCKPMQRSSAPYSKKDRFARRQEVYRLHFDLGYPAVKIAELMKINRNTINNDIKNWYFKLAKEWDSYDIRACIVKQMNRLESQRSRFKEELENQKDLESKILVERLILEIDEKISKIMLTMVKTTQSINDFAINQINTWMGQSKLDYRFVGRWSVEMVPKKKYEKIIEILKK